MPGKLSNKVYRRKKGRRDLYNASKTYTDCGIGTRHYGPQRAIRKRRRQIVVVSAVEQVRRNTPAEKRHNECRLGEELMKGQRKTHDHYERNTTYKRIGQLSFPECYIRFFWDESFAI